MGDVVLTSIAFVVSERDERPEMNRRFLAGCAAILLTGFVLNEPTIYDNFTHPLVHGSWVPTVVGAVRMAVMCLVAFTLFIVQLS